jgi:predicted transcriptional regulator
VSRNTPRTTRPRPGATRSAFGCEAQYADAIVYADGLALDDRAEPEPLGVNCRICPRDNCDQRAFPAINTTPFIDSRERGIVPYRAKAAR